jgi:hypothetical protein
MGLEKHRFRTGQIHIYGPGNCYIWTEIYMAFCPESTWQFYTTLPDYGLFKFIFYGQGNCSNLD